MCEDCYDKTQLVTQSIGAAKGEWTCVVCGEQKFSKDSDPPKPQRVPKTITETIGLTINYALQAVVIVAVIGILVGAIKLNLTW